MPKRYIVVPKPDTCHDFTITCTSRLIIGVVPSPYTLDYIYTCSASCTGAKYEQVDRFEFCQIQDA